MTYEIIISYEIKIKIKYEIKSEINLGEIIYKYQRNFFGNL